MRRRLYYLLPDNTQAAKLAVDLEHDVAIKQQNIHAVARDEMEIDGVNDVHRMNDRDNDAIIEWWGWRINLAIFFIATLVLVIMLFWSPSWWLIIPMVFMASTLAMGLGFVLCLPNVHINEFFSAIRHGEILLMIDVGRHQIEGVSNYIRRHSPAAITGGVCWHR